MAIIYLLGFAFAYLALGGSETTTACPMYFCAINCTYGKKLDANGCKTCECLEPCQGKVCAEGEECKVKNLCTGDSCGPTAVCKKVCPLVKCIPCKSGYRLDYDECQTCECIDPCEYPKCEDGEVCKSKEVQCFRAPCYPVAECSRACPQIRCFAPCNSGYRLDSNKCQTCECVDPCEYPKCEKGEVCKSKEVQCFREPCYPVAECSQACPQINCFAPCNSGYRLDINKCQTCECVDPCEYPKCEKGEVCKRQQIWCITDPCYDLYQCIKECPKYKCRPCALGYKVDENGCQTCSCLSPKDLKCKGVKCSKGQICKEEVAPCLIPPCPVIGRCYNSTTAT